MLENFITNTNNYDKNQLDHEIINNNKSFYSIYNNKISKPFHNFWFILSNSKFKCGYNENKILRFGLNNKEINVKKFLTFFKNLSDHLIKIFSTIYPNISVEFPWKDYENYPCIINIFTSDNTIIQDDEKKIINLIELSQSKTYSILFEIKNIKIAENILKFNLNMLLIQQEPDLDLKKFLLFSLNNINSNNLSDEIIENKPKLQLPVEQLSISKNNDVNIKKSNISNNNFKNKGFFDLNEILEIKSNLKKVIPEHIIPEDNLLELENSFIDQKKKLKKTITEEKSLLNSLKQFKKKKIKKKSYKKDINDIELEKELELLE